MRRIVLPALYALLALITLLPVALLHSAAIGDFPNSLSRIHLLAEMATQKALHAFFQPGWRLAPYFGTDLTITALAALMPLAQAGKLFAMACLVLPVAASAAIRRAAFGRIGLLPAFGFLFSYNYDFSRGFMNYLFSASLAMLLFAAWIAAARRPRWFHYPLFGLALAALYLSHVFTLAVFGLLTAGYELGAACVAPRNPRRAATRLALCATLLLPTLAAAWATRGALVYADTVVTDMDSLAGKIGAAFSPVYFPGSAGLAALFAALPLAGLALLAAWRRRTTLPLLGALLLLALAAAAMPRVLFNMWGTDFRLPVILVFTLLAAVRPAPLPGPTWQRPAAIAVLLILVALRSADAARTLGRVDAMAEQIRAAAAALPPAQRVLVAQDAPADPGLLFLVNHLGSYATLERDAVLPTLFAYVTPLAFRADSPMPAAPNTEAPGYAALCEGEAPWPAEKPLPRWSIGGRKFWMGWPWRFDYLLVIHHQAAPENLPGFLHKVSGNGLADLYRIEKPEGGAVLDCPPGARSSAPGPR